MWGPGQVHYLLTAGASRSVTYFVHHVTAIAHTNTIRILSALISPSHTQYIQCPRHSTPSCIADHDPDISPAQNYDGPERLLGLSAELRNRIFGLVLSSNKTVEYLAPRAGRKGCFVLPPSQYTTKYDYSDDDLAS